MIDEQKMRSKEPSNNTRTKISDNSRGEARTSTPHVATTQVSGVLLAHGAYANDMGACMRTEPEMVFTSCVKSGQSVV